MNNLELMLTRTRDPYKMLKDANYYQEMTQMLSANYYCRQNMKQILKSELIMGKQKKQKKEEKE